VAIHLPPAEGRGRRSRPGGDSVRWRVGLWAKPARAIWPTARSSRTSRGRVLSRGQWCILRPARWTQGATRVWVSAGRIFWAR